MNTDKASLGSLSLVARDGALAADPKRSGDVATAKARVDLANPASIAEWGDDVQEGLARFNNSVVSRAKASDMGESGALIADVLAKVKGIDSSKLKGGFLSRLFGSAEAEITRFVAQFNTVEQQVDGIAAELLRQGRRIGDDARSLSELYDVTYEQFGKLEVLIQAGQELLEDARTNRLPAAREAAASGHPFKAQELRVLEGSIERMETKVHDFETLRMDCIQTAQVIQMMLGNALALGDGIRSTVQVTVTQWKKNCVIAIGLENQRRGAEAINAVRGVNNAMIVANAKLLGGVATEVAKQSSRPTIDVAALEQANQALLGAFENVAAVHRQAAADREQGRVRLAAMETDMRRALSAPQRS